MAEGGRPVRRAAGYLAASVVVAGAFVLGFFLTQSEQDAGQAAAQRSTDRSVLLIDEVREELNASYYRWIHPDVLARPTVDGIIEGLDDPHTEVLTAVEFESLRDRTDGTYSGIGLTVGPATGGLVVTSAYPGPAKSAGIQPGDVIVRINGAVLADKPFESALTLIKGQPGTVVRLRVRRPPKKEAFDVEIMRRQIAVPPISARLMRVKKQKVAYIRIFSFSADAAQQLTRTTSRLVAKGASGAIIDLRDNPGGLLSQAVDVASIFIADGIVCRTAGLHEEEHTYRVTGFPTHPKLPLVVLVNGGSASAAEIVAGALVDQDRATLVGQRTFGKASVQTVAPLTNGRALKLTTAKYVTPAGADITGEGLHPSVEAVDDPLTAERDEAIKIARRAILQVLRGE
jgi:carboxyl-terminal processing protease